MMREHTDPPNFWMQMKVDKARRFVSIARKMGYDCWIDEQVTTVTIWPDPFDMMLYDMEGVPAHVAGRPQKLRLNENGYVAVFKCEIRDYGPAWDAFRAKEAAETAQE
jgi:hypothetical protein